MEPWRCIASGTFACESKVNQDFDLLLNHPDWIFFYHFNIVKVHTFIVYNHFDVIFDVQICQKIKD